MKTWGSDCIDYIFLTSLKLQPIAICCTNCAPERVFKQHSNVKHGQLDLKLNITVLICTVKIKRMTNFTPQSSKRTFHWTVYLFFVFLQFFMFHSITAIIKLDARIFPNTMIPNYCQKPLKLGTVLCGIVNKSSYKKFSKWRLFSSYKLVIELEFRI